VTNAFDRNEKTPPRERPGLITALPVARHVANCLGKIAGVAAVALGGSRARRADGIGSDVDLGIYYQPSNPPSVEQLRHLACELHSGDFPPEVTGFGEWGAWVNGGAWLKIQGFKVDWLYRDLQRVSQVIEDCAGGAVTCDYYLGHPHGFHNHIYLAEIHYGHPLLDPFGILAQLKQRVSVYPSTLKTALVTKFLYDASFMLALTAPSARRSDVFHVSGCLFRCAAATIHVLFALNETYFMNEKGALNTIESFPLKPDDFSSRVRDILASPGKTSDTLKTSLAEMEALIAETRSLANAALS